MVVGVIALAGDDDESRTFRYDVPAGTGDRLERGEEVDLFPKRLEARVGDRLVIRNDDARTHQIGPFTVGAGETFSVTFSSAGTLRGLCTLHPSGETEIVVRGG